MWDKIKKYMGYVWASPLTLLGAAYAGLFTAFGWYKWARVDGDSLVWKASLNDCPLILRGYWTSWAGHAIGNVVVMNDKYLDRQKFLMHEQKHVNQMMRLGIFQPLLYGLCYVGIKLGCPGSHPYYDNPFEIDARRHAGQIVDVVSAAKKVLEQKGKKQT